MVLWAGGWCYLLLALFYLVVDVWKFKKWSFPFIVIGANAIFAYMIGRPFDAHAGVNSLVYGIVPYLPEAAAGYFVKATTLLYYGVSCSICTASEPLSAFNLLLFQRWERIFQNALSFSPDQKPFDDHPDLQGENDRSDAEQKIPFFDQPAVLDVEHVPEHRQAGITISKTAGKAMNQIGRFRRQR